MKRLWLLAAGAIVSACGGQTAAPRPQWRVTVATDAPLPQFGDRLLVEVLDKSGAAACHGVALSPGAVGCRRLFPAGDSSKWPKSFGIAVGASQQELYIRARLYRSTYTGGDGLPAGPTLIDYVGRLPAPTGVTPAYVDLSMRCFGIASRLDKNVTCDPSSGKLVPVPLLGKPPAKPPVPDSWEHAGDVPCKATLPKGMACIAGGSFLLGSHDSVEPLQGLSTMPERLVVLDPFALDVDEVTVGDVRQLVAQGTISGTPTPRDPSVASLNHACTYYQGADDPQEDKRPVNCVSRTLASEVCHAVGKRLPTEAEWEFAASNRNRETTYSWGEAPDPCAHAIIAIGRTNLTFAGNASSEDPSCRTEHPVPSVVGPLAGGSKGDVTGDGINNLAGNVAEWVSDIVAPYDAPCWQPDKQLLVDPACTKPPADPLPGNDARGGNWAASRLFARSTLRLAEPPSPYVGFRCAKSL